jgi:hypothetical protein
MRPIINPTMKLWVKDEVIGNMWYLQPETMGYLGIPCKAHGQGF